MVGAAGELPDSVGSPGPDSVPEGDGEPDPDPDIDGDCEGDPDCGDPELGDGDPDCGGPDCGELDCGGGLPELPVGGGGACGGWLRKIKMAISTARAASSSINSQETRMDRQPARSYRPGQGSGHIRARPGWTLCTQYCW